MSKAARTPLGLHKIEPFMVWPLVFSAGADQEFGLKLNRPRAEIGEVRAPYDLYGQGKALETGTYRLGELDGTGGDRDNIHNHDLMRNDPSKETRK